MRHADFVVLGKAIGSGHPLAALRIREGLVPDLRAFVRSARLGGTHSKEVTSARAALYVARRMRTADGYARLPRACRSIVRALVRALDAAGVGNLVGARSVFAGSLFELVFHDIDLINDLEAREDLQRCLLSEGVCLVEGHAAFVCLAHERLDLLADLERRVRAARRASESSLHSCRCRPPREQ